MRVCILICFLSFIPFVAPSSGKGKKAASPAAPPPKQPSSSTAAGKRPVTSATSQQTAKQIVASSKIRNKGGSFGPDVAYGPEFENVQFDSLSQIKARGLAREVKFPRQYNNPKNPYERESQMDAKFLSQFPKKMEKAGLKPNGRCAKLFNEIMGWQDEYFEAEQAAEDARICERMNAIKQRGLEREREGGQRYPRRIPHTQQDYDANALRKIPKGKEALKVWEEIQSWKGEAEPSHMESRAEGTGKKRIGRGQFVEPQYNKEARAFETQRSHSMKLRGATMPVPPAVDAEGAPLPDLFPDLAADFPVNPGLGESSGAADFPVNPGGEETRWRSHSMRLRGPAMQVAPPPVDAEDLGELSNDPGSGSFSAQDWMDEDLLEDPRVGSSNLKKPHSFTPLFAIISSIAFILLCWIHWMKSIPSISHHDTMMAYTEL